MSGAAQREDAEEALVYQVTGTDGGLKQAVAERLAAHRNRRAAERDSEAQALAAAQAALREGSPSRRGSLRVREAVAARYEQSVSYRDFLAVEAERALQQAQAAAEVATRTANAVAEAKMQLMEELEQWNRTESHEEQVPEIREEPTIIPQRGLMEVLPAAASGGLSVRLYEDTATVAPAIVETWSRQALVELDLHEQELRELDEEIEFRRAPELEPYVLESQSIPGNLIEFPRQLVASRKSRPRLAEGPLREDAPAEPQLRIFEVEAEQISAEPVVETSAAPEWQSLLLDASNAASPATPIDAQLQFTLQPQTAPLELRMMAGTVDLCWIGAAFAGFATVVVELTGARLHEMPIPMMAATAAAVLAVFYVVYQVLFFSLMGGTPGMRYARIGLCTFGDRNPSRKAMRRRVLATLLAACPLGLGLAWACLDEERLGWHDRMSRMYQRAY